VAPTAPELEAGVSCDAAVYDQLWDAIIAFFSSRDISIAKQNKAAGTVTTEVRLIEAGADPEGLVALGQIVSTAHRVRQSLKPSEFTGSGNINYVRANGTITGSKVIAESAVEDTADASYRVSIAFVVLLTRSGNAVNTKIDIVLKPDGQVELINGWAWTRGDDSETVSAIPTVVARLRNRVDVKRVDPTPLSMGVFEQAFMQFVRQRFAYEPLLPMDKN
jgi:hypothetical protein